MMPKRIILIVVLVTLVSNCFAQLPPQTVTFKVRKPQKKDVVVVDTIEEPFFVIVEENATFQGGDINTFRIWVQSNMVYPTAAAEAGISGKVIVQFAVNSRGQVINARVLRGAHPALDAEALRVVLKSPRWMPGKQGGKPVNQQFVIPIVFQLQ